MTNALIRHACCGARCRHCSEWREARSFAPPARWCESCQATTYVDERGCCIPCGGER